MNVGFLDFGYVHNKTGVGSVRIRVDWVINHWPEAEKYKIGKKYDCLIFQKAYLWEIAEYFDGIKIIDICDPDWFDMQPVKKMIDKCDAVTVSSPALKEILSKWTDKPVMHIPDRIDFDTIKEIKKHEGEAQKVVWFGYHHNSYALKQAIPYLKQMNLELIIISEKNERVAPDDSDFEETWIKYKPETVNEEILKADIVLFPPSLKFKDRFKSNNKTVQSWALGMPVANNLDDLKRFLNPNERIKEQKKRLKEVKELYDVKLSVNQYKELINELAKNKKQQVRQ